MPRPTLPLARRRPPKFVFAVVVVFAAVADSVGSAASAGIGSAGSVVMAGGGTTGGTVAVAGTIVGGTAGVVGTVVAAGIVGTATAVGWPGTGAACGCRPKAPGSGACASIAARAKKFLVSRRWRGIFFETVLLDLVQALPRTFVGVWLALLQQRT